MKKLLCSLLLLAMIGSFALAEAGLNDFTTIDMEGNTVTQEIFADYDLTVLNVWATWCGYCIEEMPELAKLKTMLPENVNFITLCEDAHLDMDLANKILTASGANFQTLVLTQEIYDQFFYQIQAFPTTFFLDSEGMPVVDPIVGVPSIDAPADTYYALTMGVLSTLEG